MSAGSLVDPLSTPLRHHGSTVVVVDDESVVCEALAEELAENGYKVFTATEPAKGANIAAERVAEGDQVLVVGDFKMPTTTGKSFYGGFELALWRRFIDRPILRPAKEPPLPQIQHPAGHPLAGGVWVSLEVTLPWQIGDIAVEGTVEWSNFDNPEATPDHPLGVGLCLANLPEEARDKIATFIERFHELVAQLEDMPAR